MCKSGDSKEEDLTGAIEDEEALAAFDSVTFRGEVER